MRPALQRLLERPRALNILHFLVGTQALAIARRKSHPSFSLCCRQCRSYISGISVAAPALGITDVFEIPSYSRQQQLASTTNRLGLYPEILTTKDVLDGLPIVSKSNSLRKRWDRKFWTTDELEFQSDVLQPSVGEQRLVDNIEFGKDINLWAFLWRYRTQKYGLPGVYMFWEAIRSRRFELPVEGIIAASFWSSILELGFKDEVILHDIWTYSSELYVKSKKRWLRLYFYVMEYMVLNRGPEDIMTWHRRLYEHHSPSPAAFSKLFRRVIDKNRDIELLKQIYIESTYRNIYSKIVPTFSRREQYETALDWHFFLIKYGDLPSKAQDVEPLMRHFKIHDLSKAELLGDSLVSAGISFSANISIGLGQGTAVSREMMNVIHGKTFNVKPKNYNDKLGSRWLATAWISLDVAMESLHSLGIVEIGPLSLQAIALREPDFRGVVRRLDQLKELGISTGDSVFSRAVESFARRGETEYLRGLLESDQHPESLENRKLQESLLASYALVGDTVQYALAMAVLLLGAPAPRIREHNIILRCHITNGDISSILQEIEEMRIERIPVQQRTIDLILQKLLAPRPKGKRVSSTAKDVENLYLAISILRFVMNSGWRVSVSSWCDIIRRLGMLGRLDDLDYICVWLAKKYRNVWLSPPHLLRPSRHDRQRSPAQINTSDPQHPLKILFSAGLQRAIVEWGFIHEQSRTAFKLCKSYGAERQYTRGLKLLRRLSMIGVEIEKDVVERALIVRLRILYSPGDSKVPRNRRAREQNAVVAEDMIGDINEAFGERVLPLVADLEKELSRAKYAKRQQEYSLSWDFGKAR